MPAFFLSSLGGEWADRYDKAKVAQRLKLVEFGAVAIAGVGFLMNSLPLLFVALGLFGVLSALFGPVKYGILPDHLSVRELPGGNALIEGATFIAAILGPTVAALASQPGPRRSALDAAGADAAVRRAGLGLGGADPENRRGGAER